MTNIYTRRVAKISTQERALLSPLERRTGRGRATTFLLSYGSVALLVLISLGPLVWMIKASLSSAGEIRQAPFSLPEEVRFSNYAEAWTQLGIGQFTVNSLIITGGVVLLSVGLSVMIAFTLAIVKPKFSRVLETAILATLFIPAVISLVPLYMTVIELKLLDSYWAVWLPAGANALNVLLILQYLRGIPAELFEAARIDGAGPLRMLLSIALPLCRPVLGAVALLSFSASWKDYLWPLLALPSTERQPLSVALSRVASSTDQAVLMAGLVISVVVPVAIFIAFQRQVLQSAGASGALKG